MEGKSPSSRRSCTFLTCSEADIPARVEELAQKARESERELGKLKIERAGADADAAVLQAKDTGKGFVITRSSTAPVPRTSRLSPSGWWRPPGRAVIAVDRSPQAFQWIIAHSRGEGIPLPSFVAPLLGSLNAKGGGRGAWMQGAGGSAAEAEAFAAAMEEALGRGLR